MAKVKRKRTGHPRLGLPLHPFVGLRMPPRLVKQIDKWARDHGITRSEAIRNLVGKGLSARRAGKMRHIL
jgi:Ribbon-helix-helix protein, copG family